MFLTIRRNRHFSNQLVKFVNQGNPNLFMIIIWSLVEEKEGGEEALLKC